MAKQNETDAMKKKATGKKMPPWLEKNMEKKMPAKKTGKKK